MIAKHTPGPWYFTQSRDNALGDDECGDECVEGSVKSCGGDYYLARIWSDIDGGRDEPRANGQLMAAAPELLAALKAMLTHMGMDEDEWSRPTFAQARAAIAKAEGTE